MSANGLIPNIRRLPGLRFEAQSPPLTNALPRMDVAVFVGFAASGPVNQPVVIEDGAQFAAIFGEDLSLGWDSERGATVRSYLGPAVRDFFRQGGRRCWIVRVARAAKHNYFPIPALLERRNNGDLLPAFASARSEGSWSDALRVGTILQTNSIEVTGANFVKHEFELSPGSPGDVQPGDLLRFNLRDEGYCLFGVVASTKAVEPEIESPPSEELFSARQRRVARRRLLRVQCEKPLWFKLHWLDGLNRERVSPVLTVNDDGSSGPLLDNDGHWSLSDQGQRITLRLSNPALVPQAGARLLIDDLDVQLLLTVTEVEEPLGSPPQETVQLSGRVERCVLPQPTQAMVFNNPGESRTIGVIERPTIEGLRVKFKCSLSLADAPAPGTVMRVDFGTRQLWLTVRDISSITDASGLSPTGSVQIEGDGLLPLPGPPIVLPETPVEAERLSFDLLVREAGDKPLRLGNLGFDEKHPRYWGAWPTDEQRYQGMRTLAFVGSANANQENAREPFPLAGGHTSSSSALNNLTSDPQSSAVYLPLAMPFMADSFLGVAEQSQSALERDGLTTFGSDLFLDAQLIDTNVENLLSQADYLRYQGPKPRSLKGIHAALDIEEATIIAVPDVAHRSWTRRPQESVAPGNSEPLAHPRWWRFLGCNPPPLALPLSDHPAWENFLDSDLAILDPPILQKQGQTTGGTVALVWSTVQGATRYVVEESRSPSWDEAEAVYSGSQTRVVIYGRSGGDYLYRVRAEAADASSEWSAGIVVRTSSTNQWQVGAREEYSAAVLLEVHRALLRLCAARGDLFAVLALPSHYREDEAITHAEILRPAANGPSPPLPVQTQTENARVAPLSVGEERATSYGAIYHPWLITRSENFLEPWQIVPPDGAACGVMAQRSVTRGAWSAPANELLRGVVALDPPLAPERRSALQDAQVNIFRHEPRGFLSLSADTLSRDIDLRPINVRRLLILLRRLALRLGETYVFEPNDDSFRRLVQRGFEAALDRMFVRGAFAGRTAATSYQVITDNSINTPNSIDQGRFIVELRVAPSLPLTFITVRLIQTNDRSSVTEVR